MRPRRLPSSGAADEILDREPLSSPTGKPLRIPQAFLRRYVFSMSEGAWLRRQAAPRSAAGWSESPGGAGRLRRRWRIQLQVLSNPSIHQAGGRKPAKQSQAVRELAGRVSDLRVRRVG